MVDSLGVVMSSHYVAADRKRLSLSQAAKHASSRAGSGMFAHKPVLAIKAGVFGRVKTLSVSASMIL